MPQAADGEAGQRQAPELLPRQLGGLAAEGHACPAQVRLRLGQRAIDPPPLLDRSPRLASPSDRPPRNPARARDIGYASPWMVALRPGGGRGRGSGASRRRCRSRPRASRWHSHRRPGRKRPILRGRGAAGGRAGARGRPGRPPRPAWTPFLAGAAPAPTGFAAPGSSGVRRTVPREGASACPARPAGAATGGPRPRAVGRGPTPPDRPPARRPARAHPSAAEARVPPAGRGPPARPSCRPALPRSRGTGPSNRAWRRASAPTAAPGSPPRQRSAGRRREGRGSS